MIGLSRFRLEREMKRWRTLGHQPRLWWRDDDARATGDALERLLRTADGLPLSLAVIPEGATPALAKRLSQEGAVTVSQHGFDHLNKRRSGDPACEYPAGAPVAQMVRHIFHGEQRLRDYGFEPRFYTPPWNRLEPTLLEALRVAGVHTLSAWNDEQPEQCAGLKRLDVHVDLLRWKGGARFRGSAQVLEGLREQLVQRRENGDFVKPVGLLTHHLDHDEAAWRFLRWFVRFARPRFEIGGYLDFLKA